MGQTFLSARFERQAGRQAGMPAPLGRVGRILCLPGFERQAGRQAGMPAPLGHVQSTSATERSAVPSAGAARCVGAEPIRRRKAAGQPVAGGKRSVTRRRRGTKRGRSRRADETQQQPRTALLLLLGGLAWAAAGVGVMSLAGLFGLGWISPLLGLGPGAAGWLLAHSELKAIGLGAISADAATQTRHAYWLGLTGPVGLRGDRRRDDLSADERLARRVLLSTRF